MCSESDKIDLVVLFKVDNNARMVHWNPLSADDWANRLGLAATPLFGSQRGGPTLLRDGEGGSFILAAETYTQISNVASSWAWSADVPRIAIIDKRKNRTLIQRWDQTYPVEQEGIPTANDAQSLIERFEDEELPSGKSSVMHCLEIFRMIRNKMAEKGHSAIDSFLVFYATLAAADNNGTLGLNSESIATTLQNRGMLSQSKAVALRRAASDFPFDEAIEGVKRGQVDGLSLHPSLTLRHAGGVLFQESHYEIERHAQQTLFLGDLTPARRNPKVKWDAVYTPPSLARTLAHVALNVLGRRNDRVKILDPACGSGAFLLAAAQELRDKDAFLRGFDTSSTATNMADLSIRADGNLRHRVDIASNNALSQPSWGNPDIILMNPPFTSWEDMDDNDKQLVKKVLGADYAFRADKSLAFIARALDELPTGSVLATIAPASFLTSQSASPLRNRLRLAEDFDVKLVLYLTGYGTFHDAVVDPACIVVKRTRRADKKPVVKIANYKDSGNALRQVRMISDFKQAVHTRSLPVGRWIFHRASEEEFLNRISQNTYGATVGDTFDIKEGVRTGDKKIFVQSLTVISENEPDWQSTDAFRFEAANNTLRMGKIEKSNLVFYPYKSDGTDLFTSENNLKHALPWYYSTILKPNQSKLEKRAGAYRQWWTLIRPRSWQFCKEPRIISAVFCQPGSYAVDEAGEFVVTQGLSWNLYGMSSIDIRFAVIAILNSWQFFDLACCFSRTLKGGQVECYEHHIKQVPFPDLQKMTIPELDVLSELGQQMSLGTFPDQSELSKSVCLAYGVSPSDFDTIRKSPPDLKIEFERLWRWWISATQFSSRRDIMKKHPAVARIVSLGRKVPELIQEKRRAKGTFQKRCDLLSEAISES